MMLSNQEQLQRLFFCAGFGVWLSLYNDLFRAIRCFTSPKKAVLFWHDILFVVTATVAFFLFCLGISAGEIRFVLVLAAAVGFAVTHFTIGRWIMWLCRFVKRRSAQIVFVFRRFTAPLCRKAENFQKKVLLFFKKGLHKIHTLVYNQSQE